MLVILRVEKVKYLNAGFLFTEYFYSHQSISGNLSEFLIEE